MSMAFEQVPLINLAKVTVADIPVAILPLEAEELAVPELLRLRLW